MMGAIFITISALCCYTFDRSVAMSRLINFLSALQWFLNHDFSLDISTTSSGINSKPHGHAVSADYPPSPVLSTVNSRGPVSKIDSTNPIPFWNSRIRPRHRSIYDKGRHLDPLLVINEIPMGGIQCAVM
ncbi:hypothetical protein B0J11DRAFT_221893 [Dendryphion nanum]|uniref:Uncharacterized protein n=1 Tax=Dendryphion nanum TaxID=256645 RepID=A0A9P9E4I3_9PLEO|nr:hypothetical protein B0J11DRAFT_221893 [Dendryphion nanum]